MPIDGEDAGDEEAAVDRLEGIRLALLRLHREHAGDRRHDTDGPGGEREDESERRVGADGVEGGDTEDDRGDERDLVALEQVGRHAGAVADVVPDVVGDGGRVAGIVLGDAGLDLADEIGADVSGLREDAAADPEEQREQRAAESEPDEDRRTRVLEDHDDDGRPEQAEADGEHAGDASGAERHVEGARQRAGLRRRRRANVASGGERHADEAGEAGHEAAEDEGDRAGGAGGGEAQRLSAVGFDDRNRCEEHDRGQRDEDDPRSS